jgi:ADP-ribose pyrophosphatase YjhB (NUDIX family)
MMHIRLEDIRTYDDLCSKQVRDLAAEVTATAINKCELLKSRGEHFRYCSLRNPPEDEPFSHNSQLARAMVSGLMPYCYDSEGNFCIEYQRERQRIHEQDELMLKEACETQHVMYVPPNDPVLPPKVPDRYGEYCSILGRNYPIKEFMDRGQSKRMPYTFRYGKQIPIVCAGSVLVVEEGRAKTYLLVQDPGQQGDIRDDTGKMDIPGGGLEWGETFEQCATREFGEERGCVSPELTGLLGIIERINLNNKLVMKAAFTGKLTKEQSRSIRSAGLEEDSKGFMYFEAPVIRMLHKNFHLLKSPDVLVLVNRLEEGLVKPLIEITKPESIIRMGWD